MSIDNFMKYVNKTDNCWLWEGYVNENGYGKFMESKGKCKRAHRLSWELHKGPIPIGMFVCHKCDIRHCVNPDHLWLGTHGQNMLDASCKGKMKGRPDISKVSCPCCGTKVKKEKLLPVRSE